MRNAKWVGKERSSAPLISLGILAIVIPTPARTFPSGAPSVEEPSRPAAAATRSIEEQAQSSRSLDPRSSHDATPASAGDSGGGASAYKHDRGNGLYRAWRRMAEKQEAAEPDWLSPLATTSGRIKDELRYDLWRQTAPAGGAVSTLGGGKGLEFIAAPRVQLLVGIPSYIEHSPATTPNGFGDMPLMLKFRIASAKASKGNYLVTAILSATAPTAPRPNGAGEAVLTPMLALGKGWGKFDVQTTVGGNLPAADTPRRGMQVVWNTTFQYRAKWKFWPGLEANSTFYGQGPYAGETQAFLTPELGFGRAQFAGPLRFSMAAGVQIAITRFHTYDHRWMLSVRFPF